MTQINFEDETLDASDGVTKLLLAAEYWKKKAIALRTELDKAKSVPMKYRRMEFNAQLQNENTRLRAELDALKGRTGKCLGGLFRDSGDMVNFFVAGQVLPAYYQHIKSVVGDLPMAQQVPVFAGPAPAHSVPDGWLRAIDDALVTTHIGVAFPTDSYEAARAKLEALIGFHVDVATDPAVNGGWQLVPIEPTTEMEEAGYCASGSFTAAAATYAAMIAAAPKPEVK